MGAEVNADLDGLRRCADLIDACGVDIASAIDAGQNATTLTGTAFGMLCSPLLQPRFSAAQDDVMAAMRAFSNLVCSLGAAVNGCADDYQRTDDDRAAALNGLGVAV